jgi:lipoate synthase
MGFLHVASGPMVRSSYHADEFRIEPRGEPRMDTNKHE